MAENAMSPQKRAVTLIAIVALFLAIDLMPSPEGLAPEGKRAIALMVCTVLVWISNALPLMLAAVASLMLMPVLGLATLPEACDMFCEPVFFVAVASYMVMNGLTVTGLDKRIALKLAVASGGSAKKLLFILMCSAALLSTVLSDMAVVLMMLPISMMFLRATGCEPGKSNYGRALMIGLPLAAYIGGMGTPAGASTNIMAMQVLENTANIKITFSQWACLGLPIVVLLTPIAFLIIWAVYKPEVKTLNGLEDAQEKLKKLGKMTMPEKKYIIFMLLLIVVWMTESLHGLNIAITTTIAAVILFLPGMNILTWDNTKNCFAWDVVVLICYCMSLGTMISNSGAATWFAGLLSGVLNGYSLIVLIIAVGLISAYAHLICPANAAIVSIFVPVVAAIATSQGLNPASLAIPISFMVSAAVLLPLDAVALVCFASGYFKMTDMFKSGVIVIFAWVAVVTVVMMVVAPMLGFM